MRFYDSLRKKTNGRMERQETAGNGMLARRKKKEGRIIDFDDTEIVLEDGEEGQWTPIERKICHNWFSVEEMRDWE